MLKSFQQYVSRLRSFRQVWMLAAVFTLAKTVITHVYVYSAIGEELYQLVRTAITILPIALFLPMSYFGCLLLLRLNRAQAKMRELLNKDQLTQVLTRERFMSAAPRMRISSGVVMMADIDKFKSVNDTYGHAAGDVVLAAAAQRMSGVIRTTDVLARLGGEEFAIFLPDTDLDAGWAVAERLRKAVAATPIVADGFKLSVTVSIGVSFKPEETSIDLGLKAADQALYEAKARGRNRCIQSAIAIGHSSRDLAIEAKSGTSCQP